MTTPNLSSPPAHTQIRRSGRLILFGLLALSLLFVASYVQRSGEREAVEAEIKALRAQIVQAHQQQAVLQDQLEHIAQPGAIDAAARNDLGLVQPGDQPIVVIDPPAMSAAAAPQPAPAPAAESRPAWLGWLDRFFPASE